MAQYGLFKYQYFLKLNEVDPQNGVAKIIIQDVTSNFIYYDSYGETGNLLSIYDKRKVFIDEQGLYIKLGKNKFRLEFGYKLLNP